MIVLYGPSTSRRLKELGGRGEEHPQLPELDVHDLDTAPRERHKSALMTAVAGAIADLHRTSGWADIVQLP
jgi:hypothetical protein